MLIVKDNGSIELTRGDTARLTVDLTDDEDQEYIMRSTDTLTMTVKTSVKDSEPCFQKTSTGNNMIHIKPEDTAELDYGKYVYDVELHTEDGDVYTVIEKSEFKLRDEVTTK